MEVVILAAGISSRLRPLTNSLPKSLLKVNGKEIISHIIENALQVQPERFIIVTGYLEDKLKNYLKNKYPEINFTFITNKLFETTNNEYSLYLALREVKKDFVLLDSDIIFHPAILNQIIDNKESISLAVKRHKLGEEEMKIVADNNGNIKLIGKNLSPEECYGESIGIEYFPEKSINILKEIVDDRIENRKILNDYYESSFQEMINRNIPFKLVDIGELYAIEIDFIEDLKRAEEILKNEKIY